MSVRTHAAAFILSLLLPGVAIAWDIEWVDQFGNGLYTEAAGGVTDATGVYVVGSVFPSLPGEAGVGDVDVYLRKYDFAGTIIWTRQFGTADIDVEFGVATDPTGVYAAGATTGAFPGQSAAGRSDTFVRKFSANGDVLWTRQLGTPATDVPMLSGVATH